MGLPAYSISFDYTDDSISGETKRVLESLDCLRQLSSEIGASFAPKFNDPVTSRNIKELVQRLVDDNRFGARIKRWWTNDAPKVDPKEVADFIIASRSAISMRDFDSPEEWAELAITAVAESESQNLCVYVWDRRWKTSDLWLHLRRDEHKELTINGVFLSTEAYENKSLRQPMDGCLTRLTQTGKFKKA